MLDLKQKIGYFLNSSFRFFEPKVCPFCNSKNNKIVDRKYMVTALIECNDCNLKFRHPYDSVSVNKDFYQKDYAESDVLTTDLPNEKDLKLYLETNFAIDPNKNVQRIIDLIYMLKGDVSKVSMVDYGCSWGYMSYQFKQKVHQLQSFEISVPRATYGNKNLGLNIVSNEDELQPQVDIFFSSHVIEHVPSLQNLINLAKKLVKPGGYIITLCPNGSDHYQKKEPTSFHLAWGKVHPNYLSDSFFKKAFKDNPKYIGTTPIQFEHIEKWDKQSILIDNLDNIEMLTIVKV